MPIESSGHSRGNPRLYELVENAPKTGKSPTVWAWPQLIDYLKVAGQPVAGPWPPHQEPRPDPEYDALPVAVPDTQPPERPARPAATPRSSGPAPGPDTPPPGAGADTAAAAGRAADEAGPADTGPAERPRARRGALTVIRAGTTLTSGQGWRFYVPVPVPLRGTPVTGGGDRSAA